MDTDGVDLFKETIHSLDKAKLPVLTQANAKGILPLVVHIIVVEPCAVVVSCTVREERTPMHH